MFRLSKRAETKIPVALILVIIIAIPLLWGLVAKISTDLGFPVWPFSGQEQPDWKKKEAPPGMQAVNRKIDFTVTNKYSGAQGAGTIYLYDSDGKTLLETLTLSSGAIASGKPYESGYPLVAEIVNTNDKIRHSFEVPFMAPADIEAVTNNPVTLDQFTLATSITRSFLTSQGTSIAAGGNLNKTTEGNVVGLTILLNLGTDNTGFMSSYDEIDKLNWYAMLYMKCFNTNYEYVSVSGWDKSYTKGTAEWYAERMPDIEVTKYKVGNDYVYDGSTSFTFTLDLTGYSGDVADLVFYLYAYSDPAYHDAKGSFGPDNVAMMTSATVNLVD